MLREASNNLVRKLKIDTQFVEQQRLVYEVNRVDLFSLVMMVMMICLVATECSCQLEEGA